MRHSRVMKQPDMAASDNTSLMHNEKMSLCERRNLRLKRLMSGIELSIKYTQSKVSLIQFFQAYRKKIRADKNQSVMKITASNRGKEAVAVSWS